jgi:hypothetical protein
MRMWQTIGLSFLSGVLGANAVPHFVKGITKETYPTVFGAGPVVNLLAGWSGLVLTALCVAWAHVDRHPVGALLAGAVGILLMGLFHAGIGAVGRTAAPPVDA